MKRESLARELRLLRLERGLTLVQAAELTGLTRGTISELELGRREAYMPTLHKIAKGYGINVRELLLDEPRPTEEAEATDTEERVLTGPKDGAPSTSGQPEAAYSHWSLEPLRPLVSHVARRVEWCERVMQKRGEEGGDNPFNPWRSLDATIQWAVDVGVEYADLRKTVRAYADVGSEEAVVAELSALLDRFRAVEEETNRRVKQMMEEAGVNEELQEQVQLRLIDGDAGAA